MKKFLKLGLISLIAAGSLYAGNYNVDTSHSEVGFKVKHMMISNVKGNFTGFTGSFEYDEEKNTLTGLNGTVQTATVNTDNKKRDKHLRAADFFDAEKYPTISFEATKIVGDKVEGLFTMKGVTKKVVFELENGGTIKDPWGNERAGFALEGKIKRSDFGLTYNSVLEAGGVAVGDEVKIHVEIEGIKKK